MRHVNQQTAENWCIRFQTVSTSAWLHGVKKCGRLERCSFFNQSQIWRGTLNKWVCSSTLVGGWYEMRWDDLWLAKFLAIGYSDVSQPFKLFQLPMICASLLFRTLPAHLICRVCRSLKAQVAVKTVESQQLRQVGCPCLNSKDESVCSLHANACCMQSVCVLCAFCAWSERPCVASR